MKNIITGELCHTTDKNSYKIKLKNLNKILEKKLKFLG